MSKAKKILCLFDYGKDCYTGFATVSKNIKREIKKYFGDDIQLDICSINHYGDAYTEDDGTFVFSAKLNDFKEDDFGRFLFLKILNESNEYDGIFVCQDIGIIQPIIEILESIRNEKRDNNKKVFKSIFYFPVDCKIQRTPQIKKKFRYCFFCFLFMKFQIGFSFFFGKHFRHFPVGSEKIPLRFNIGNLP